MPPKPKKEIKVIGFNELADSLSDDLRKEGEDPDLFIASNSELGHTSFTSSSSLLLDWEIHNTLAMGGVPDGRIIEVYGPEHAGKSTTASLIAASYQRHDKPVVYLDTENALTNDFAENYGVDTDPSLWLLLRPKTLEQTFAWVERSIHGGAKLIIVDSIANLVPKAEAEGDYGDAHMGLAARLIGQALRKLSSILSKNGATLLLINQVREKIGVVYGDPETTPGGRGVKFNASLRLRVSQINGADYQIGTKDEPLGHWVRIKAVKNRFGTKFDIEVPLMYGEGFDTTYEMALLAEEAGVIQKSGSFISLVGDDSGQKWQGAAKFGAALKADPELRQRIMDGLHARIAVNKAEWEARVAARKNRAA